MTPFTIILVLFFYFLHRRVRLLQHHLEEVQFSYQSANVKHGKRWEHFVPFMEDFSKVATAREFCFHWDAY
ncbi:MAG: hypothetical protein AABW64_03845 [Nanoarchaeota archaeon]